MQKTIIVSLTASVLAALWLPHTANATRITEYLHRSVKLNPDQTFTVKIVTNEPYHVGWSTKQKNHCKGNCVEGKKLVNGKWQSSISAQHGASVRYEPSDGKIIIEYKNVRDAFVIIDVYKEKQICDSEACDFLRKRGIKYPFDYDQIDLDYKRILSKKVTRFDTSKDGSYTNVEGESVFGTKFKITILWWFVDDKSQSHCKDWILPNGTYDLSKKKAYQFSGSFISKPINSVMIETGCMYTKFDKKGKDDI